MRYWEQNEPEPQQKPMPIYWLLFLAAAFVYVVAACGLAGYDDGKVKAREMKWATPQEFLK